MQTGYDAVVDVELLLTEVVLLEGTDSAGLIMLVQDLLQRVLELLGFVTLVFLFLLLCFQGLRELLLLYLEPFYVFKQVVFELKKLADLVHDLLFLTLGFMKLKIVLNFVFQS